MPALARRTPSATDGVRYLRCRVEPGMFRDEYLVLVQGRDRSRPTEVIPVQLLVDRSLVIEVQGEPRRHQPAAGWLRVTLAGTSKGTGQVILPQAGQPVGESMLVELNELREAAS